MRDRDLAVLVQRFHAPPEGLERRENGYWYSHCGCGYVCARRRTAQDAAEALVHHMRKIGKELIANGVSLDTAVGGRALDEPIGASGVEPG